MADFKKVFSRYGYSLFESESGEIEDAIIDALKSGEIRYILGIPVLLEKTDIDYERLMEKAKEAGVLDKLLSVFSISARIINDKGKREMLKKTIGKKKIRKKFRKEEFEEVYKQYSESMAVETFPVKIHRYLSVIFTPRQIEILYKIKKREKLTKTEREYYSRVIKKRLTAIKELAGFADDIL